MKKLLLIMPLLLTSCISESHRIVELPGDSPLVTLRIVFLTGAASDPSGLPGVASLTASMLSDGGTQQMSYQEILDSMFPMATSVSSQVDKEMTSFTAVTHVDNLDEFYNLFHAMLLEPGWREEDLTRLRDQAINYLRVELRSNNDEELGKEVLYSSIYEGHPYQHQNAGTVSSLQKITMQDLKDFYRQNYTRSNLVIGIAGGYPQEFLDRLTQDFNALPGGGQAAAAARPEPKPINGIQVRMVEKDTRSVAYSFGFPIDVKRGDPDYLPLLVAQSYLGPHRNSGGRLFNRMRQERGLNYGDYAYIEYFPRGMFLLEPDQNLARPQQIFQIWIRPVETPTAHFALRLAFYELDKFIKEGISAENFERTRSYLTKYVNLLTKTKQAELGYSIDSLYYDIPGYVDYVKQGLASLTAEQVNAAIRKHLRTDDLYIAVISKDCEALRDKLLAGEPSPMIYNSPKPPEILEEDKIVEKWEIPIAPDAVTITPVDQVFE